MVFPCPWLTVEPRQERTGEFFGLTGHGEGVIFPRNDEVLEGRRVPVFFSEEARQCQFEELRVP